MGGVHALVAEDTANLVHPIHAAHDQPLQVQLGFNAQHHVEIQGVVVGVEGTGGGSNLKGSQDGGIHFQEALAVQEVPQLAQNQAALDKGILHLGIDNQIHIALPIAHLPVGQSLKLVGQGQQRLAQQGDGLGADRNFLGLGLENLPLNTHNVADVVFLEAVVLFLAHFVNLDKNLDSAGAVLEVAEHHLALPPLAHQAARHPDSLALEGSIVSLNRGGIGI